MENNASPIDDESRHSPQRVRIVDQVTSNSATPVVEHDVGPGRRVCPNVAQPFHRYLGTLVIPQRSDATDDSTREVPQ